MRKAQRTASQAMRRAAMLMVPATALTVGWPLGSIAESAPQAVTKSIATGKAFTPIVMQSVYPPAPFEGSDGHTHLAYEVLLTNTSPRQATVTGLTVRNGTGTVPSDSRPRRGDEHDDVGR